MLALKSSALLRSAVSLLSRLCSNKSKTHSHVRSTEEEARLFTSYSFFKTGLEEKLVVPFHIWSVCELNTTSTEVKVVIGIQFLNKHNVYLSLSKEIEQTI